MVRLSDVWMVGGTVSLSKNRGQKGTSRVASGTPHMVLHGWGSGWRCGVWGSVKHVALRMQMDRGRERTWLRIDRCRDRWKDGLVLVLGDGIVTMSDVLIGLVLHRFNPCVDENT